MLIRCSSRCDATTRLQQQQHQQQNRTDSTLHNHTAGGYVHVGLAPEAGSALLAIIAFPRLIAPSPHQYPRSPPPPSRLTATNIQHTLPRGQQLFRDIYSKGTLVYQQSNMASQENTAESISAGKRPIPNEPLAPETPLSNQKTNR